MCLIMVCHIGVWLGTEVVKSALRMLALYMYFNGRVSLKRYSVAAPLRFTFWPLRLLNAATLY